MKRIFIFWLSVILLVATSGVVVVCALDREKVNILVMGVDGREADDVERSDAIILVNYDYQKNDITATSIPRDSYVKIACRNNSYDKINHAYAYGGSKCLNDTVSQLFGINDVKNIIIDFDDVIELVDYFGLIEIVPNFSFCQSDVKTQRTYCFEKNKKIQIDGRQALAYMRARKNLPLGDFDRIKNQRQVFKVLINEFLKLSLIEKISFYNYVKKIIDTDLKLKDMNLRKLINVQQIKLNEYTLKGEDYYDKYYYYKLDLDYLEKIKKNYI